MKYIEINKKNYLDFYNLIKLNDKGINKATDFFAKYHKNYSTDEYEFNIDEAISEVSDKATSSDSLSYELSSFESIDGCPKTISFNYDDFEERKIMLDDIGWDKFYDLLIKYNVTKYDYDNCVDIYEFLNKHYNKDISVDEAINEAANLFKFKKTSEIKDIKLTKLNSIMIKDDLYLVYEG